MNSSPSENEMDVAEEPPTDPNATKTCPICSRDILTATYRSHLIHCLGKFKKDSETSSHSSKSSASVVRCLLCHKDVSHMSRCRQQQHQNKCVDQLEAYKNADGDLNKNPSSSFARHCPICLLNFSTLKARAVHLRQCAKNSGISSDRLLEIVSLHDRQARERVEAGFPVLPPPSHGAPSRPRNAVRERTRRQDENQASHEGSEELQMAMAMSLSLQQQNPGPSREHRKESGREAALLAAIGLPRQPKTDVSKGKRRTKKDLETPLLLLRSAEDRAAIVGERVAKILAETYEDADYYAPFLVNWKRVPPHVSRLKTSDCRLWKLAALSRASTTDPDIFYVKELQEFVSPCKVKSGDKLKRLSQVPGYVTLSEPTDNGLRDTSNSGEEEEEAEDGCPAEKKAEEMTTCTQDLLLNLRREDSQPCQIASQGFFLSPGNAEDDPPCQRSSHGALPPGDDNVDQASTNDSRWPNKVLKGYLQLVCNSVASDCCVELKNGTAIPCHAAVLYANCRQAYDEIDNHGILKWNVSKSTAVAFLQFLYGGTIVNTNFSPIKLISIAQRYNLQDDVEKVIKMLGRNGDADPSDNNVIRDGILIPVESSSHRGSDNSHRSMESFPGDMPFNDDELMVCDYDNIFESAPKPSSAGNADDQQAHPVPPTTLDTDEECRGVTTNMDVPSLSSTQPQQIGSRKDMLQCRRSLDFSSQDEKTDNRTDKETAEDSVHKEVAVDPGVQRDIQSPDLFSTEFNEADDELFANMDIGGVGNSQTDRTPDRDDGVESRHAGDTQSQMQTKKTNCPSLPSTPAVCSRLFEEDRDSVVPSSLPMRWTPHRGNILTSTPKDGGACPVLTPNQNQSRISPLMSPRLKQTPETSVCVIERDVSHRIATDGTTSHLQQRHDHHGHVNYAVSWTTTGTMTDDLLDVPLLLQPVETTDVAVPKENSGRLRRSSPSQLTGNGSRHPCAVNPPVEVKNDTRPRRASEALMVTESVEETRDECADGKNASTRKKRSTKVTPLPSVSPNTSSVQAVKKRKRVSFCESVVAVSDVSRSPKKRLKFGVEVDSNDDGSPEMAAASARVVSLVDDDDAVINSSGGFQPITQRHSLGAAHDDVWDNFYDDGYCEYQQNVTPSDGTPSVSRHSAAANNVTPVTSKPVLVTKSKSQHRKKSNHLPGQIASPERPYEPASSVQSERPFENDEDDDSRRGALHGPNSDDDDNENRMRKKKKKKKNKSRQTPVTPLPHYSLLPTPEIHKALSKVGVKMMSKTKAAKLLKHIYEETHPLVPCDSIEGVSAVQSRTPSPDKRKEFKRKSKKKKSNEGESSLDDGEKINDFIKTQSQLYEDMLEFKAINIRELKAEMISAGIKISSSILMSHLDKEGIVFTDPDSTRKVKKTKKRHSK